MPAGPTLRMSLSPNSPGVVIVEWCTAKLELAKVGQESFHSFVSSERQLRSAPLPRQLALWTPIVVQSQTPTLTLLYHEPKSQNIGTLETIHITVKDSVCWPQYISRSDSEKEAP